MLDFMVKLYLPLDKPFAITYDYSIGSAQQVCICRIPKGFLSYITGHEGNSSAHASHRKQPFDERRGICAREYTPRECGFACEAEFAAPL
jgi:hypothetical protein